MFHGLRTRIAFAIAVAAIVGSSFASIAPAFAEPLAPSVEHELGVPKKPDLAVSIWDYYHSGSDNVNLHMYYQIYNVGNAVSSAVPVKAECEYQSIGSSSKHWVAQATVLAPIQTGDHVYGEFQCNDATGARITAGSLNDSNVANNTATYDWHF